jgi:hypothetical protein
LERRRRQWDSGCRQDARVTGDLLGWRYERERENVPGGGGFTTEDTEDTEKEKRKDRKRKTAPLKTNGAAPKRDEKSENPTHCSGVWSTRRHQG